MPLVEDAKKVVKKVTGFSRPSGDRLAELVRARKPDIFRFRDDGFVPNHPAWPLILYRNAVELPQGLDPAAVFEDLFQNNGWGSSWRNGIYSFVHYHSRIHEVLGIASGSAKVKFGGNNGRSVSVEAGDVAILPAGTGHQLLSATKDLLVVGAYPPFGTYDLCTTSEDHERAVKRIPEVGRPQKDPVYGSKGPLLEAWS